MRITNGAPDPDAVVSELLRILVPMMEAWDRGMADAREYHHGRGFRFDSDLANAIVRKWIKQSLVNLKLEVREFDVDESVRNIGLRFRSGPYEIRVWKTRDGELPFVGRNRSVSKRHFMENGRQLTLGGLLAPRLNWDDGVNLCLLWCAGEGYAPDSMFLVLPKAPPSSWFDPGDTYWHQRLDFADLLAMLPQPQSDPDEPLSLPFSPKEEPKEDTAKEGE